MQNTGSGVKYRLKYRYGYPYRYPALLLTTTAFGLSFGFPVTPGDNNHSNNNSNNNNNNNNNRIQRRYSRFFTVSSQRRELSPTRTLKWPRRKRVQITCNTPSAHHVQLSFGFLVTPGDNNHSNNSSISNNNNNNSNRIQRRYSRFFTVSSQRRELSPTRTLKWPGHNRVQITCNTSSAYRVQHVLRATWYEGTAQLLCLTELKSHLYRAEIAFI